jgi:hypothetical protein
MGGGHEDAPVLLGDFDADNAPVVAGADVAGLVALGLSFAFQTVSGGGAAEFEGVAVGLRTLEGQVSLLAGGGAVLANGSVRVHGAHRGGLVTTLLRMAAPGVS